MLGPFDYLYGHPGKDIRAQLIAAFNAWLRVPEESLAIITKVIGMLHTASLLYVSNCLCTYYDNFFLQWRNIAVLMQTQSR